MPTETALAPSVSAAATPRPSPMPPAAMIGQVDVIGEPGDQRQQSDELAFGGGLVERAAMAARFESLRDDGIGAGGLRPPWLRPASSPWRTRRCPSLSAARRMLGGNTPMMDDTAVGASSRKVSSCASKSGNATFPASAGTAGPQLARKARMRASTCASRRGGGSGIQTLSWNGPRLFDRNSSTQARMPAGGVTSAPIAPMLPALATAIERLAGHAPAIGASRMGNFRP